MRPINYCTWPCRLHPNLARLEHIWGFYHEPFLAASNLGWFLPLVFLDPESWVSFKWLINSGVNKVMDILRDHDRGSRLSYPSKILRSQFLVSNEELSVLLNTLSVGVDAWWSLDGAQASRVGWGALILHINILRGVSIDRVTLLVISDALRRALSGNQVLLIQLRPICFEKIILLDVSSRIMVLIIWVALRHKAHLDVWRWDWPSWVLVWVCGVKNLKIYSSFWGIKNIHLLNHYLLSPLIINLNRLRAYSSCLEAQGSLSWFSLPRFTRLKV